MWLLCPFIDSSDHCRGLERFQTFVPSHNLLGFANQGNTAFRKARLGRVGKGQVAPLETRPTGPGAMSLCHDSEGRHQLDAAAGNVMKADVEL